jgi:hypothetical protein
MAGHIRPFANPHEVLLQFVHCLRQSIKAASSISLADRQSDPAILLDRRCRLET